MGLLMAVPCFLRESPLDRFLMTGFMAAPLAVCAALVTIPPIVGMRERLAWLFDWCSTRAVRRIPRSFNRAAFLHLLLATAVMAVAVAMIKAAVPDCPGVLLRWLGGAIAAGAFAGMTTAALPLLGCVFGVSMPPLMQSPWRSATVDEFWGRRWNVWTSAKMFRPVFRAVLSRHGFATALAATFAFSGVTHALMAFLALGKWPVSLACGVFFLVQPVLMAVEHRLGVRRWPVAAARAWTLTVLLVISPLFIEPALQVIEPSWGGSDTVLPPVFTVLAFVLFLTLIVTLGSLAARPAARD